MFSLLLKECIDLLFPRNCLGCGREETWLCTQCAGLIQAYDNELCPICRMVKTRSGIVCSACISFSSLASVWIMTSYEHLVVQELVRSLKYQGAHSMMSDVHPLVLRFMQPMSMYADPKATIITAIPLHASRLRERGFNQAELLAQSVAACLDIPIVPDILKRTRNTPPQAQLSRTDRLRNLYGAFVVKNPLAVREKHVMLVDDVATTCTTMLAAADVLRHHGALSVQGIALARGSSPQANRTASVRAGRDGLADAPLSGAGQPRRPTW
ncbi:MAG: ComF family protein [Parcubacteria group bacterium]